MKGFNRRGERGQTLVVVAVAMVAILLGAGLVIDGGWAFAQQRTTQNAMDAAADAGAVALVQNLPFTVQGQAGPNTDQDVLDRIVAVAGTNGVTDLSPDALYTDITGVPLPGPVAVGSLGAVAPPAGAYGVEVHGAIQFGTFFAGIAGMTGFTASARATAVAGSINTICATDEPCAFIPVTFPSSLSSCDGQNRWQFGEGPYIPTDNPTWDNESIVPICGTADGSVGWLDIEPHDPVCGSAQGAALLTCDVENPYPHELPLPIWIHTVTGNIQGGPLQNALDAYSGPTVGTYEPGLDQIVYIPLYDCIANNVGQVSPGPACPAPPLVGVGSHTYYHIVAVLSMILDQSVVNGVGSNPSDPCKNPPGSPYVDGNGATGCLKGWFTQVLTTGPVGIPDANNPNTVWGVQLVR
jgi:hypothetical protein